MPLRYLTQNLLLSEFPAASAVAVTAAAGMTAGVAAAVAAASSAAVISLDMARRHGGIDLKITAVPYSLAAGLHIDPAPGRFIAPDVYHHDSHAGRANQHADSHPC